MERIVFLVLLTRHWGTSNARPIVNSECNLSTYYDGFFQRDVTTWTRDELEDLTRRKHTNLVPFFGNNPESGHDGDILAALLELNEADGIERDMMKLFYSNQSVPEYPLDRTVWVPEHICPLFMTEEIARQQQSLDFDWAYSDLHNIQPVHPLIHESNRGTQYFGICSACEELFYVGSDICVCGDFFQPAVSDRGIIARTWLYMQLRYPDLAISRCHLEELLGWHAAHPPTMAERQRNDAICSDWQGNRNPYIDFPSIAWEIRVHETSCDEDAWYGDGQIDENLVDLIPTNTRTEDTLITPDDLVYNSPISPVDDTHSPTAAPIDDTRETHIDLVGPTVTPVDETMMETPNDALASTSPTISPIEDTTETPNSAIVVSTDDVESPTNNHNDTRNENSNLIEGSPEQLCSEIINGDILFYVLQAKPSRIGLIPLVDVPVGLELYLTTSIASLNKTPLIRLQVDSVIRSGNPFGYGNNLLMGDKWNVANTTTSTLILGVNNDGGDGDDVFLFCNMDSSDPPQRNIISAITTSGAFLESDVEVLRQQQPNNYLGTIILPEPRDYYVYDGPFYTDQSDYQRSLTNPTNWLAVDFTSSSSTTTTADDSNENIPVVNDKPDSHGASSNSQPAVEASRHSNRGVMVPSVMLVLSTIVAITITF